MCLSPQRTLNKCEKGVFASLSGLSSSVGLQHYSILQGQRSDCAFMNTCISICLARDLRIWENNSELFYSRLRGVMDEGRSTPGYVFAGTEANAHWNAAVIVFKAPHLSSLASLAVLITTVCILPHPRWACTRPCHAAVRPDVWKAVTFVCNKQQ